MSIETSSFNLIVVWEKHLYETSFEAENSVRLKRAAFIERPIVFSWALGNNSLSIMYVRLAVLNW
jgi:hypothetical protein